MSPSGLLCRSSGLVRVQGIGFDEKVTSKEVVVVVVGLVVWFVICSVLSVNYCQIVVEIELNLDKRLITDKLWKDSPHCRSITSSELESVQRPKESGECTKYVPRYLHYLSLRLDSFLNLSDRSTYARLAHEALDISAIFDKDLRGRNM